MKNEIEIVRQKGRWENHISIIVFTSGERRGEILGSINHKNKTILLPDKDVLGTWLLTPEIMVGIGEAFKTFKF